MFRTSHSLRKSLAVTAIATLIAVGCAHKLEPVAMPATANPIQELQTLAADMDASRTRQTDVLSPKNFAQAEKYFEEAKYRREKNQSGPKILESIGTARAYLNESEKTAKVSDQELHDVIVARQASMTAGARNNPNDLADADRKLIRATSRLEEGKGVDIDTRTSLHQTYLDLELNAIKTAKLSEAQNMIAVAENKGAKKLIPNTYWSTVQKVTAAEKVVETDRHDTAAVNKAAEEATATAKHMITVLETAMVSKNKNPESIALELDSKNRVIAAENERLRRVASEATNKDKTLGQMQDQVEDLQAVARLDKVMRNAQSQFSGDEADVYRQGSNLLIRLKSFNFASGGAEIPNDSLGTLRKVKDLIGEAEASSIVVEGHTDAVGSANLNRKLSEKRADAVSKYLVDENVVEEDHVRSVGYGFERPIASNKSRDGRKQNRRVDIVIKMTGDPATRTE